MAYKPIPRRNQPKAPAYYKLEYKQFRPDLGYLASQYDGIHIHDPEIMTYLETATRDELWLAWLDNRKFTITNYYGNATSSHFRTWQELKAALPGWLSSKGHTRVYITRDTYLDKPYPWSHRTIAEINQFR